MSTPATFEVSRSATSSPASASGLSPFGAPAGQMIDLFGPVPVLANLSARQAKALGLLMSGTYGRPGTTSSKSMALQSSLVSRLQARLACSGSTVFKLTWKQRVTPSGRLISALRGSALPMAASGCISWPTPTVNDSRGGRNRTSGRSNPNSKHHDGVTLVDAARMHALPRSLWSAPTDQVGYLNPELSRWLQAIPRLWSSYAPTETASMLKRRRNS